MDTTRLIKEMNSYYNARARWHDDYMAYSDQEQYSKLLRPVVKYVLRHVAGKNVLEIACGTGSWTWIMAEKAERVLAVDVSGEMLKIAGEKCRSIMNIRFLRSDAYTLIGVTRKYDLGFAADWISHVPRSKLDSFLNCLHRKLRPGSEVIILEMHHRDHPDLNPYRVDQDGNAIIKRWLPDGRGFDVVKNYYKKEEITSILQKYSSSIEFKNFIKLSRWLICYRII